MARIEFLETLSKNPDICFARIFVRNPKKNRRGNNKVSAGIVVILG